MKYLYALLGFFAIINVNAQSLIPATISTNGTVHDMDADENNLYIAGSFSQIGINANYHTLFPLGADRPNFDLLQPNSTVNKAIPDGNGGWYLTGSFSQLSGQNALRIAHILPDLSLDPNFNLSLNTTGTELVLDGDNLYVGGFFTQANGIDVNRIIRVNKNTGVIDNSWLPGILNGTVNAIYVADDIIHVGGSFNNILGPGDQQYYAQLDPVTGVELSSFSVNNLVNQMVVDGDNLYLAGAFNQTGSYKSYLLSFSSLDGFPEEAYPDANSTIETIIPDGDGGYYVAGSFTQVGEINQSRISHILNDGTIDPDFNTTINSTVHAIQLHGANDLYICGSFTQVNGEEAQRIARLNSNTGALDQSWTPTANSTVLALEVLGDKVHIGGFFTSVNGNETIRYYVPLDINTGEVIYTESTNSIVYDMEVNGDDLYLGGSFNATGYYRPYLQLLSPSSDIPNTAFPFTNSTVNESVPDGNGGWYIAGSFTTVNGTPNTRVAHILNDYSVDPDFDCSTNSTVETLHIDGDDLYIGGSFTSVNSEPVTRLARVNKNTGALDNAWSAELNSTVLSIKTTADKVLVGGSFSAVNQQSNTRYFTALDKTDGSLIQMPSPNSTVNDIEMDGDNAFISGSFSNTSYPSTYLATFSDGAAIPDFQTPFPNSTVQKVISDGNGGYYLSGSFSAIDGTSILRVTHFLADGSIDPDFTSPAPNSTVDCMALDGSNLYIGGSFTNIGGTPVARLAKLNATTGALDESFTPNPNSTVNAILTSGGNIYFGGSFTEVQAETRNRLAAVDANGDLIAWNPDANSTIVDMATNGTDIFVGGSFSLIGGITANRLAGISIATGALTSFNPSVNSTVNTIAISGSNLYIGGSFSQIDGTERLRFASLNTNTGALNSLNIEANSTVESIALSGSGLIALGGSFTLINGENRSRFAEITIATAALTSRNIALNGSPRSMLYTGNTLVLGGSFTEINATTRNRIAEYNTATLSVTDFEIPNINSTVNKLIIDQGLIYFAGSFTSVNGTPRSRLASANIADGSLTTFNPNINSTVNTIALDGNNIYIGGSFTEINTTSRLRAAAINTNSGTLTDWNPQLNSTVNHITLLNNEILIGGSFIYSHFQQINYLAVTDVTTTAIEQVTDQSINSTVHALHIDGNTLYAGGSFTSFDGQPRTRLAAFDIVTNTTTSFDIPGINSTVQDITTFNNNLYFGGDFTQVDGQQRGRAAVYDLEENTLLDFNPSFNSTVNDIDVSADRILFGGSFSASNQVTADRIVSIDLNTNLPNIYFTGINSEVRAIAIQDENIYAGGFFTLVNGESRLRFASLNKTTGELNPLFVDFNNLVNGLTIVGDDIYMVGSFTLVNDMPRGYGASFNLTAETLNDFNPRFNSSSTHVTSDGTNLSFSGNFTRTQTTTVQNYAALALDDYSVVPELTKNFNSTILGVKVFDGSVYLGGYFSLADGQTRNRIASLSTSDGSLDAFDPNITGSYVDDIEGDGDNIYFCGNFNNVSGTSREDFAGYNKQSNTLLPLNLSPNSTVIELELGNGTLYLGGVFTQILGETRNRIAEVDLSTGELTTFDPSANNQVHSLKLDGNLLYAGGFFSNIGGQTRQRIAALSTTDGTANSWAPALNGNVEDIEIVENYLFATGAFTALDGESVSRLVLIDKNTTENLFSFAPPFNSTIFAAHYDNEKLFVGGQYSIIGQNYNHPYFSVYNIPPPGTSTFAASMVSNTDVNGFDIACNGQSTGELTINVSGGTPPYTYTLTNTGSLSRSGTIEGTSATESNLPAGNYTLSVEDSDGGVAIANLALTQPAPFTANASLTSPVTTVDGNEASVTLALNGGISPFEITYTQDGGDPTIITASTNTVLIEDLSAGNYNFTITDDNGCVSNESFQINNYTLATVALTLWDNITCNGDDDGRLRIQLSGGLAPYDYVLDSDDDNFDRTGTIFSQNGAQIENNLGPGTYNVTVTDVTGAVYTDDPFVLVEPTVLSASIEVGSNPSAPGVNDGSINLTIEGGSPNYFFTINRDGSNIFSQSSPGPTAVIQNLLEGEYFLTLTDANGCQITTNTIDLIAGIDPCIDLGGDSDGDGICDDNDPCPLLADLENGENCGVNGTIVNCECVEECNLTLGTPVVTCLDNTAGDDDYTVSISYSGSDPGATVTAGNTSGCSNSNITISGNDPATEPNGTILLTANEADACWGITISGGLCDITLSGDAPACNPGVDCPDLGLNNGDPCGDGGTVVDCDCLFPDCNGDLGGTVVDADEDGVCDDIDNCLGLNNPNQDDLDGDNEGDACDDDIDGDGIVNADDCDPLDDSIGLPPTWYADADGDGYGTDEVLTACTQPDGYAPLSGDCDDSNPDLNPGAQTLTFAGTAGFENALINPLQGSPNTTFNFAIVYTDASGNLPPVGFPRVLLDFEGNGVFNNVNDRAILLSPADQNDLNTVDGKLYVGSINQLPTGTNWEARIQVQTIGCITEIGPFDYPDVLSEPDLEIFADDIAFDNPNPDVSSPLTITATVRNVSDLPAENFVMHLVNQFDPDIVYPDITVPFLGGQESTTVVWDIITPAEPSWNPMEVFVDFTNVIEESNELDNRAVRPFTNGDYNVPGAIVVDATASPAVQFAGAFTSVNVSGYAYYVDTAVPLQDPSVAGATVSIINPMSGGTVVANTNSQGYFSINLGGGTTPGIYSASGEVTDFTLTGPFTVSWELLEAPCLPDLSTNLTLSDYQIFPGESIDGTYTVTNIGCAPVEVSTRLDATQTGGLPIISDAIVPPLAPGESFTYNFTNVQFDQLGTYTICGLADADFIVAEASEGNNLDCENVVVVPPLPDITPTSGPVGNYFFCTNLPLPSFTIRNVGYVPTGEFDYTVNVFYEGAPSETYTQSVDNLNAGQAIGVSVPYVYQNLGSYSFTITCDIPMPTGIVTEISELNNIGNYSINIIPCKPDLTVLSCNQLDVDPADLEIPGTATYTARIRNTGNATATAPVDFEFTVSNGEVYTLQYDNDIAPGETVTMTTDAPSVVSGTATLTANVDQNDLIDEFNENNNATTDSLCWEYAPVPKCGYNFWNTTYYENQSAFISVGLLAKYLYKASEVTVRFEVSGPGIVGTALLGDATVQNVEQNCNCPYVAALPTTFIFNEVGTYTFTMTADPDNEYPECNEGNNVLIREVNVANFPDMRILSEFINPTLLNPEPGESVFFDITYENIGVSNIDDEMDLTILVDEEPFATVQNVSGLINGENNTIAIAMPYSTQVAGAHIIRAIIDSGQEIAELNELNNEATRALIVGTAANLFFEVFIPSDSSPIVGDGIDIDATIGNNGDIDVDADVIFSYISNGGDTIQIGSLPVSVLAGGSQDITLPWTVLDNNTTLLGEIVNASEIEFDYSDNFASAPLSNFDLSITSTQSCEGQNLGSLTANASNGTEPYTYNWSNGFIGQTLEAGPGTYSVTVTDAEGLEANASGTITENPDCINEECSISAVSFNIPDCNPETGVYMTTLVVAYNAQPDFGFISVNGEDYGITGSPQSLNVPFSSGAVNYNVSFTGNSDCSLTIITGIVLDECVPDCEGTFGGEALPGTPCETETGAAGTYDDECNCVTGATATLLTLECGAQVIQITGASPGNNPGGNATDETRTIYAFAPDNGNGLPSYTGTNWPYVIIEGDLEIDPAITAALTLNPDGVLLVNGWPAYQFVGDASTTDVNGTFGPWNYFLIDGTLSQDACEEIFDCPELEANIGDSCDDNNPDTENDTVNDNCECQGTPIFICLADGGDIEFADGTESVTQCLETDFPGLVDVTFASQPSDAVDGAWVITNTSGDLISIPGTEAALEEVDFHNFGETTSLIWFLSYDADNSNVLELAQAFSEGTNVNASDLTGCFDLSDSLVVIGEFCNVFDCPELEANIGDSCDDNNPDTENDTINENCECQGTPVVVFDCPELEANIGDACNDGNDETGNDMINENCECEGTPIVVPDCASFVYYLSDHSAAEGISDIFEVTLIGGFANMTYIATSEIEVHIAFNEQDNLIYALSKFENSYRILDPSTGIWGPAVMLGADYGEVTAAVFNADGKLVFGSQDHNAIYCVNVSTNVVSDYDTSAPVTGGDLAFAPDGMLYLATRSGLGSLYEVYPDDVMPDVLIGSVPELVTGMATTDTGDQLLISAQGNSSLVLRNTDGSDPGISYTLDFTGEPYTLRDGDLTSGCEFGPPPIICFAYTAFYVNHGPDIEGSDLYYIDFTGGNAVLTLLTNVEFEAHIAYDSENNIIFFVNKNGDFVRLYDIVSDVFIGDLPIIGPIDQITAVEYNPEDNTLFVGDADSDVIATIDMATGISSFYANAPVSGGDLALVDGTLYLARRSPGELYEIVPFGDPVLLGDIPEGINGMARTDSYSNLITSSAAQNAFVEISRADGVTQTTYPALLNGEPFTFINGDMAAGCPWEPIFDTSNPPIESNSEFQSQLTSYPNPTLGASEVVFVTAVTGRTLVEVYDMNGRNVTTLFNQTAEQGVQYKLDFDGSYLPNGIYIYKLTTSNETMIRKFMIAR